MPEGRPSPLLLPLLDMARAAAAVFGQPPWRQQLRPLSQLPRRTPPPHPIPCRRLMRHLLPSWRPTSAVAAAGRANQCSMGPTPLARSQQAGMRVRRRVTQPSQLRLGVTHRPPPPTAPALSAPCSPTWGRASPLPPLQACRRGLAPPTRLRNGHGPWMGRGCGAPSPRPPRRPRHPLELLQH